MHRRRSTEQSPPLRQKTRHREAWNRQGCVSSWGTWPSPQRAKRPRTSKTGSTVSAPNELNAQIVIAAAQRTLKINNVKDVTGIRLSLAALIWALERERKGLSRSIPNYRLLSAKINRLPADYGGVRPFLWLFQQQQRRHGSTRLRRWLCQILRSAVRHRPERYSRHGCPVPSSRR